MTSEHPARADAGFTLIEVLIAMVILAIGLLAVEALGIGAARTVQRARVQSAYTALATDEMEQVMATINQAPDDEIDDLEYTVPAGNGAASGAQVTRTATFAAIANTQPNLNLWTVVVSVLPPSGSSLIAPSDSVHLESNVIR